MEPDNNCTTPIKEFERDVAVNTSPGQLQDVTMDNSYALGYRSPCISLQHAGSTSPGQGRSVREFEEQMASLRKENFNLKLRIYFLEEKIPGYSSSNTDGHESLLKQNVDLKVDIEVLRKELQEKQSLLCEAAKAMELMEQQQKDTEEKSKGLIDELNQKIHYLEMENRQLEQSTNQHQMDEIMGRADIVGDMNTIQKVRELEGCLKQYNEKTDELNAKIHEMQELVTEKDRQIQEFEDKMKQIAFQNAELQEQLDIKGKEAALAERKLKEFNQKILQDNDERVSEIASENQALLSSIEKLKAELEYEKISSDERNKKLQHQQKLMEEMQFAMMSKMKVSAKLSKAIEDYEKTVAELRAERKGLQREIITLKNIIVKLEHSKVRPAIEGQQHRTTEIFLGRHDSGGGEIGHHLTHSTSRELSDRSSGSSNGTPSNNNRANPLFFAEPLQIMEQNIGGDNECCHSDYKLKQKINMCPNKRTTNNNIRNSYPHPSFYISETKNFHNSSSSYPGQCHFSSQNERRTHSIKNMSQLTMDISHAIESFNSDLIKQCSRSNSQQDLGPRMIPGVKQSSSDTSIVSASSIITMRQINHEEIKKKIRKIGDEQMNQPEKLLKSSKLRDELHQYKMDLADKKCLLEELGQKLNEKSTAYDKGCKRIQKLTSKVYEQEKEIKKLKKASSLVNETHIKEDTYGSNSTDSSTASNLITSKLQEISDEKNAEINKLKTDVRRKRSNLLSLINEEIWQKNNQIENLTNLLKRLDSSSYSIPTSPTHIAKQFNQLQNSFTESEYEAAIEVKKHLQKKIDMLLQSLLNLPAFNDEEENIYQLKAELNNAREEVEKAHRWRKQTCLSLTERLEELAGFLDSLLKQKGVLCALADDRSREMRKAIDKSLDISRSLHMSLSFGGISMPEHSLAELCNISGLLDMSVENKENSKTFNSHKKVEKDQSHIIERLQTEIKALKKELSRRKLPELVKKERRSLPLNFEDQTDSEAVLSEPDRNVSLARIGLENSLVINHRRKIEEEEKESTSSESGISRKVKSKTQEKINQLERLLTLRDDRLLDVQCELVEADNRLKQENLHVVEITLKLEEYKTVNEILQAEIKNYKSEIQQLTREREGLQCIVNEKSAKVEQTREERDKLNVEVRVAEMKIDTLKKDIDELKEKHEKDLGKFVEQEKLKLDQLQSQMSAHLEQKLKEQENQHRMYLARDWVSRVLYDEIKCDLEIAQNRFKEAQNILEDMKENENDVNKRVIEMEISKRNLKQSLDEATLQASKAVIERTKIQNDKLQLEGRLQEMVQKLAVAEDAKTELTIRLTHLEETNALLQNSLRQLKQSKKPCNGSEGSHSGYTSEDVPMPIQGRAQRTENSSPDLGIESDAGRASSVELTGVQNRLLNIGSIENLGSAENVLEKETWQLQDKNGNDDDNGSIRHDCRKAEKKILELEQKLKTTKRSLMDTYKKLQKSNQKKEQIEREIRQQLVKTHDVLKAARTNVEKSGLEQNKKEE